MTILRLGILASALVSMTLHAQEPQLRDPWVPESVKSKRTGSDAAQAPTRGAALRAQVEQKLREAFDAADVEGRGSITREQARAAGLGKIVREFAQIDAAASGRITFDDYRRHLRARGAAF